jgi:hypothetical protein
LLDWPQTMILLISASLVASIIGRNQRHPAPSSFWVSESDLGCIMTSPQVDTLFIKLRKLWSHEDICQTRTYCCFNLLIEVIFHLCF